jgi:hypothetical protein
MFDIHPTILGLVVTVLGAIVAWLLKNEKWKGLVLTRQEHSDICQSHHAEIKAMIDALQREHRETRVEMHDFFTESRADRRAMLDKVHAIELDVARFMRP